MVAAFTFRTWLVKEGHQQRLASLDLFGPNLLRGDRRGLFERALMGIERARAAELWPAVPARVGVSKIGKRNYDLSFGCVARPRAATGLKPVHTQVVSLVQQAAF